MFVKVPTCQFLDSLSARDGKKNILVLSIKEEEDDRC